MKGERVERSTGRHPYALLAPTVRPIPIRARYIQHDAAVAESGRLVRAVGFAQQCSGDNFCAWSKHTRLAAHGYGSKQNLCGVCGACPSILTVVGPTRLSVVSRSVAPDATVGAV